MNSPESKRKSNDRTSNPILKCRKNSIVIFFFCLDFCAGLHIPEVSYVMICCSSWISTQKRTPSGVAAPDGVFLFVLTALAYQAVKPLAQIIGYYLCYATATTAASGGNREELLGPRPARCGCRPRHEADAGSRNPYRMPEGPQCQYNTSSDTIQQKATAYDHTVPAAAFLFFLPSTAFFIDKAAACYYNNVVKMASLCGFVAVQNK